MRNAGLEETQTGIKIAGRNINNLRYIDDTIFLTENDGMVCSPWNFRINGTMTFIKQFRWSSRGRNLTVTG